jgi:hypothetical protein
MSSRLPDFRDSSYLCCFGPADYWWPYYAKEEKEENRMPSRRWLARLTIPLMAGAALVGSSAIAIANPQDDAYLAQLRAVGLTWPPNTEEALIGEADLSWGWQPQTIADDIHDHLNKRGVTLLDVGTMVDAAHRIYCPGNNCDAPTLCT